jgi:hypothetical protein
MRTAVGAIIGFSLLAISTSGWPKGSIVRIVIEGDGLAAPVEITAPDILGQFSIWNGPGVMTTGQDGNPHPPAYLDSSRTTGRFIDWPEGIVSERPSGLQRFEVTFHIGVPTQPGETREYIFAYEVDSSQPGGYIYLSKWKGTSLIYHGVEGNWFYASERWNELIMPVVAVSKGSLTRRKTTCTVGTGSIEPDGSVIFGQLDDHGKIIPRWRFEVGSENYASVRAHIGNVQPGEQFEVSCWPPRT